MKKLCAVCFAFCFTVGAVLANSNDALLVLATKNTDASALRLALARGTGGITIIEFLLSYTNAIVYRDRYGRDAMVYLYMFDSDNGELRELLQGATARARNSGWER